MLIIKGKLFIIGQKTQGLLFIHYVYKVCLSKRIQYLQVKVIVKLASINILGENFLKFLHKTFEYNFFALLLPEVVYNKVDCNQDILVWELISFGPADRRIF